MDSPLESNQLLHPLAGWPRLTLHFHYNQLRAGGRILCFFARDKSTAELGRVITCDRVIVPHWHTHTMLFWLLFGYFMVETVCVYIHVGHRKVLIHFWLSWMGLWGQGTIMVLSWFLSITVWWNLMQRLHTSVLNQDGRPGWSAASRSFTAYSFKEINIS